jgi:hypothetical protein
MWLVFMELFKEKEIERGTVVLNCQADEASPQRNEETAYPIGAKAEGEVKVSLKVSGYTPCFEQRPEELGHQVWLGDAAEIRRLKRRRQFRCLLSH